MTQHEKLRIKLSERRLPAFSDFRKIWNPHWFQGRRKRNNFFEGWYMKHVSSKGDSIYSFIPGVSLNKKDSHAFVQAINGKTGETWYFRYPVDAFSYTPDSFDIAIGNNRFSSSGIKLDLDLEGQRFAGEIRYSNNHTFPVSIKRPGIMGWYRYAPFMQCYHGVVSLDHDLDGNIRVNGQNHEFTGGKGYVEKDWGSSMPEAWVWMQSNHFKQANTSLMLSVARVPWMGSSFPGFLGFLLYEGKELYFATYTGAKIKSLESSDKEFACYIEGKDYYLHIEGEKENVPGQHGSLKAPSIGQMDRVIHESVNARLVVVLTDKRGNELFKGTGEHAGLEMVGDTSILKG